MRQKKKRCVCGKKFRNIRSLKQHLRVPRYRDGHGVVYHTLDYAPHPPSWYKRKLLD